jgi:hypothetical protein
MLLILVALWNPVGVNAWGQGLGNGPDHTIVVLGLHLVDLTPGVIREWDRNTFLQALAGLTESESDEREQIARSIAPDLSRLSLSEGRGDTRGTTNGRRTSVGKRPVFLVCHRFVC